MEASAIATTPDETTSTSTMAAAETSVATTSAREAAASATTPEETTATWAVTAEETTATPEETTATSTEETTATPEETTAPTMGTTRYTTSPTETSTTMPDLQPVASTTLLVETSAMPTTPASETTVPATTSPADVQNLAATANFDTLKVSLVVALDELRNVARIRVSGPADVWFGVAFDASSMADLPYAIVVDGTGDETGEWKLGKYTKGERLDASLQQVSAAVMDGMRFVEFERPLLGLTDSHFTFATESTTLGVLAAIGSTGDYGYHAAREIGQLDFAVWGRIVTSHFSADVSSAGYELASPCG